MRKTAQQQAEAHRERVMKDAHPESPGSDILRVSWRPDDSFLEGYRAGVEDAAKVAYQFLLSPAGLRVQERIRELAK
jgi:hypothetical protein